MISALNYGVPIIISRGCSKPKGPLGTTCYLRDIERDYADFNAVRNEFYRALGLNPFPASTAIQARICRSDLLVEIEAIAMLVRQEVT